MKNKEFWKLRIAEGLYLVNSRVMVSILVLMLISGTQYYTSSTFLFCFFLTRSLCGIFIGNRFEHHKKKTVLLALSSLFCLLAMALGVLYSYQQLTILTLPLIAIILAFIDSIFSSVVDAYIPLVVQKTELENAYRKTFIMQAFIDLFGLALGMTGIALIGYENVMMIIIASAALSVFMLGLLNNIDDIDDVKSYQRFDVVRSLKLFFHYKFEPRWALLSLSCNMILLPFSMMVIPYFVSHVVQKSPIYIGVIEACASLGVLLASLYLHKKVSRILGNTNTISLAFVLIGLPLVVLAYQPSIAIWLLCAFVIGASIVLNNVTMESKRASIIPKEHRVKIQTMHNAFINLANPIGFLITGLFLAKADYFYFLLIGGLLITSLSVVVRLIPKFKIIAENADENLSYKDIYGEA